MAIIAFLFSNWKSGITVEQRLDFMKRMKENAEKNGVKMLYSLLGVAGSEYSNIAVLELPNYATFDKLVEDSEWQALVREPLFANNYTMLTRTLPIP